MPTYEITAPDGRKFKVNAPDGASQQDALVYVQKNLYKAQPEPAYDPTEGMSTFDKVAAGAGKAVADLGRGVGQFANPVLDFVAPRKPGLRNLVLGTKPESRVEEGRREVEESRKRDAALMNTGAGTVGNIAGNIAVLAPTALIPGANTIAGASLIGAASGAAQPSASAGETALNATLGAAGGAVGQKIGDVVGRVLGGAKNANVYQSTKVGSGKAAANASASGKVQLQATGGGSAFGSVDPTDIGGLTANQQSLMAIAKNKGYKFTPGQATGSKALQQLEAKLESQPMTSGAFNRIKEGNQRVLNRTAAQAIGENADYLDAGVLERAVDRIGGVYNMVKTDAPAPIDPDQFITKLGAIENEFEGLIPVSITDNPLVKRLYGFAENGQATQRQLADLTSKLNRAAHNQMTSASGDRELGKALFQVKDMADDLLESNLTGETLKSFQKARGEYRNLMLLTQRQGVVNPANGNVSGANLANALTAKDKSGYMFNKNQSDLYNAARIAQAFKPIVGDSGTATRSMITNPMEMIAAVPFNLATSAYTSSPAVNITSAINRGVAPEVFTPGLLDALSAASRSSGIGLLNSVEK